MELYRETNNSIDISSAATVLTYTYTGSNSRIVLARVELGSSLKPIDGGTNYVVTAKIEGVEVVPATGVAVAGSATQTILQGRELVLENGDVLTIEVTGALADTDVATVAILMDATPATVLEITGEGEVLVDHDYGGTDVLTYRKSNGQGIGDATVQAFLASDYDAGLRSRGYIKGESKTNVNGRWVRPMMLDPEDYVLLYYKQGSYGPDEHTITVA